MIALLPMTSLAIIQESSNQSSGLGLSIPKPRLKRKFAVISIFSVTPQTENYNCCKNRVLFNTAN